MYSGHYTTYVNCCEKTFCCNNNNVTEYEMIDIETEKILKRINIKL